MKEKLSRKTTTFSRDISTMQRGMVGVEARAVPEQVMKA
jgi:hypothetical protein